VAKTEQVGHAHGVDIANLTIFRGGREFSILLDSEFVLGSSPTANLVVEGVGIAPAHLSITPVADQPRLTLDPRGEAPVAINGCAVFERQVQLNHRDRIEVAGITLLVLLPGGEESRSFADADGSGRAPGQRIGSSKLFRSQTDSHSLRTLYDLYTLGCTATSESALLEGAVALAIRGAWAEEAAVLRRSPSGRWATLAEATESGGPTSFSTYEDGPLREALGDACIVRLGPPPVLYVPIIHEGSPQAVLVVVRRELDPSFQPEQIDLVAAIGRQLGLALARVRLLMQLQASQQSHERWLRLQSLDAALSAVPEGLVLASRDGRTEPLSQRGAMLWGQVKASPDVPRLLASSREGERLDVETVSGEVVEVAATWSARLDASVVLLRDVTEQRRLEAHQRAAERLTLLGELSASLVHELGTPLQALVGHSHLLANETDGERIKEHCRVISKAGDTCAGLIRAVLSLAGAAPLQRGPVDLRKLVDDTFLILNSRRIKAKSQFLADVSDLDLEGDSDQLRQVFSILVLNGLQAIEESEAPDGWIRVKCFEQSGRARVEVSNSGPLIKPTVAESLFQPFVTTRAGGSGLGLSTARRVVEAHQGTLALGPPKPTTFVIELPLAGRGE